MAETQEQQRQDVVREPIVRNGTAPQQAAPSSGTAGKQNVVREPIVRQPPAQNSADVNPETSPQRFNPIPSFVPGVGRPDSIPHAPALETATHSAGEAGKALWGLGSGIYGLGKDLLFSEGANDKGETQYGAGGLIGMTDKGLHPLDRAGHLLNKYVAQPYAAEQKKAQTALAGDPRHPVMNQLESFGHGLASVLPLVGSLRIEHGRTGGYWRHRRHSYECGHQYSRTEGS